jgi:hypothetical protein
MVGLMTDISPVADKARTLRYSGPPVCRSHRHRGSSNGG